MAYAENQVTIEIVNDGLQGPPGPESAVIVYSDVVNWDAETATLKALLYVDGAIKQPSQYEWSVTINDVTTPVGSDLDTLYITPEMEIEAVYNCTVTWTESGETAVQTGSLDLLAAKKAHEAAAAAQSTADIAKQTADSKRTVFVIQPTPPYHVGDLWVKEGDGEIISSLITDGGDFLITSDGDLFEAVIKGAQICVCVSARLSGAFDETDWSLAATDNTSVNELREWFWHDATGAHILGDATGYRNDLDSTGMHIRDTADEATIADFATDKVVIGKDEALSITNEKATESAEIHERFVTQNDSAEVGSYIHKLKYEYLGDLSVYIAFGSPNGGAIPASWTKTIDSDNFGNWSITASSPSFSASGSISFDSTTDTISLTVSSISQSGVYLLIADAIYTTYPRRAAIAIGDKADLTDDRVAFAVGYELEHGNALEIRRSGDIIQNGSMILDFVVDENPSGAWWYRKWKSGKIEAWMNASISCSSTTGSGNVWVSTWSTDIPSAIGFSQAPQMIIGVNADADHVFSATGAASSATAISGKAWRKDQSDGYNVRLSIYAWGN